MTAPPQPLRHHNRVLPKEVQDALRETQMIGNEFARAKALDEVMRKARAKHPSYFK